MGQYMLFVRGGENAGRTLTAEQAEAAREPYSLWAGNLHNEGKLVYADEIEERFFRLSRPKGDVVTEGPLPGTRDGVHGYFVFKAYSEQQALEIARACPILEHGGFVELHRIID